jgi:ABC-type ATPase with predicted acetyltransferase domain
MQNCLEFNIEKKSNIDKTFRVSKVMSDFDLKVEHSNEHFEGKIEIPEKWNIGVIVGNSGTGKTTIAKQLFKEKIDDDFEYKSKSVIDDMPKNCSIEEICKMFYSVGFGSVPSWLKPYNVLSNGEKMRVDLARKLLQDDFIVFDEFTSVVDGTIAETMCIATNKAIKKLNKKIIVVSCHYDIINWLQPDWIFDTNEMKNFFIKSHELKNNLQLEDVTSMSGRNLGNIII